MVGLVAEFRCYAETCRPEDLFDMYSAQACKSAMHSPVAFCQAVHFLGGILSGGILSGVVFVCGILSRGITSGIRLKGVLSYPGRKGRGMLSFVCCVWGVILDNRLS